MKLFQLSTLTGRGAGLLAKMIELNPLLNFAEFRLDPSSFLNVPDKSTFTSTSARAANAAVQKDAQTPNPTIASLALYGREVAIDDVYKKDAELAGSQVGLQRYADRQLESVATTLAAEIQADMIAGTGASNRMLGLSNFVKDAASGGQTAALGFTTAEQAAMNQNISAKLDNVTDQNAFVETLIKAISTVPGANAILVNSNLYARLNTIALRIGAAGESKDIFGQPVKTFDNLPLISLPTGAIPQTESDGTNADCTSLYVTRFAETQGVCFSSNSGFYFQDFPDYQSYAQLVARLQIFLNLVVERTDAVKRLSRIRL
jgi:hypothetical protein